jgi:hypothetical protein
LRAASIENAEPASAGASSSTGAAESPIVVFLGPSLPVERARGILRADYRPEARKGDIYRLLTSGAKTIVLIDGIFHSGPSVWQREILAALDEGMEVFGASSMGALRAAELHRFGMVGHGTVFEWYRDGVIDGDDEVALRHATAEHGYRALSEPLVNIRSTLARAEADGVLTHAEAAGLLSSAKRTYYPERSYRALLTCALVQGWSPARLAELDDYLRARAVDIKARDAISVLEHCARSRGPVAREPRGAVDLWSEEFQYASLRFRVLEGPAGAVPWPDVARVARQSAHWPAARLRATARWFLTDWARLRGLVCPGDFARSFEARWRRAEHVGDGAGDRAAWSRARGLTSRECAALIGHDALVAWLRGEGPAAFGLEWEADEGARIDSLLSATGAGSSLSADESAFIAGWARDCGVRCPRRAREERLTSWGLLSVPARRDASRELAIAPGRLARILDRCALADWVVAQGPEGFGLTAHLDLAIIQELQFSGRLVAELRAPARTS